MNPSTYFMRLKQEANVYSNILFVLDKVEHEGHLTLFSNLLTQILEFEVKFAISELQKFDHQFVDFDINAQLVRNTLIFKENLKLILNSLGNIISRLCVDGSDQCQFAVH